MRSERKICGVHALELESGGVRRPLKAETAGPEPTARYHMATINDEEAMFETLDPVPSEIATAISDGLNAFNESAEIIREAFAIVWRENGRLIAGITASALDPGPGLLPEARICRIRQGQRACGRPARRPDLVPEGIFRRNLIRSRWRLPI